MVIIGRFILNPLISVIVPVYNVEKYLNKCVDSIIHQTFTNLEIILVDDGSTDKSGLFCENYAALDQRIKVIHKTNGGLSDARNKGIEKATGEFITFIDSDDFIELDMIEYLYRLLCQAEADISVCQRNEIEEGSNSTQAHLVVKDETIVGNENCMKAFFECPGIDTIACGKLYRKELFNTIRYPEGKYHEDVFTTYLLIAKCHCVVIGSQHKYNYLLRKNSISRSSFQLKHLDAIEANKIRSAFIQKNYPECSVYANAGIIYATNSCVLKLIESRKLIPEIIDDLQENYRSYEWDFLRGRSSLKAKFFSVCAYINLRLLIKLSLYFHKN